jgi:hypothetical protein
MDLGLRILHHPDRAPDLPAVVARQYAYALANSRSVAASSVASDGKRVFAAVSVRQYADPLTGSTRYGLLLTGPDPRQAVMADAPAKRHAMRAYRELVHMGHETYVPTPAAPYAWDVSDVRGIPTNLAAA